MSVTLSRIGGRWKPTILWLLWRSPLQYSELLANTPNITERMLSLSLKELAADGLVTKHRTNSFPARTIYELTAVGRSLERVLQAMSEWGESAAGGKR